MNAGDPRDRAIEASLSQRTPPVRATAECLDAETLAAYADGGLGGSMREAAELHLASCAYCQTVMATVVASAHEVIRAPADVAERSWWSVNLRWLMPLAGAATAAVLWMVVPGGGPVTQQARTDDSATSFARESTAEAPPPTPASPPAADEKIAPEPPGVVAEQGRQQRARAAADAAAPENEAPGRRAEADVMAKAEDRSAGTGATPAPAPSAPQEARAAETDQPPPPAPAAAAPAAQAFGVTNQALLASPSELRSLDPAVRWRLAEPGVVERSVDGGASWDRFDTGVRTALMAGACPSTTTCWVVGDAGVVLLTTDAQTWRRVTPPSSEDFVAVEASDGSAAIVTAASGRQFRTSDAGATWAPLPQL